jgi:molybdopterin-binding protein
MAIAVQIGRLRMELSARNQLPGTVSSVTLGGVMAEVAIDLGHGLTVVAAITRGSAEKMNLAVGDRVVAVVKATEVLVGKSTAPSE